jgi:DNA-binding response OmpR family regulator
MYRGSHGSGDRQPSILVVDDEDAMRRMFTRALGEVEFWCASTGSGVEAIELLELQRFDLAVIDKNLPDVSGLEVARLAREADPPVPVIIVTGYPSDASRRVAERLGVHSYMHKPFGLDDLRLTVRKALLSRPALQAIPPAREVSTIPPPHRRARAVERDAPSPAFLLIEPNLEVRSRLSECLSRAGYRVVSFRSPHQAEMHARHGGYDILVASPEILEETRHWSTFARGEKPLGSLAIVAKSGFDTRVEARMTGARGILVPSLDDADIMREVGAAIARMREEK